MKFNKLYFPPLLLIFIFSASLFAQTNPGEIAFVAYNADGTDGFAIVTFVDIPNGAEIIFNENEWDGTVFNTGEGVITWTNTGGIIAEGTVIVFENLSGGSSSVSHGSISTSGSFNLNVSGEALYAHVGSPPTSFLAAIANNDFTAAGASLTGTGLTVGSTAIELDAVDADADVAVYIGANSGLSAAGYLALIGTPSAATWDTQDASGDQSQDATFPDFPDDVPGNFTISSAAVPTLSEWGMIIMALLMGLMAMMAMQAQTAVQHTGNALSLVPAMISISRKTFLPKLGITYAVLIVIFLMAMLLFGYELTAADPWGVLISGGIIAFGWTLGTNQDMS